MERDASRWADAVAEASEVEIRRDLGRGRGSANDICRGGRWGRPFSSLVMLLLLLISLPLLVLLLLCPQPPRKACFSYMAETGQN